MKGKISRLAEILICTACFALLLSGSVNAKEENTKVSSLTIFDEGQEYGELYGAPYSETDDSEWLTLKLGGRGLRIVGDDNTDIVLIDQFGFVYIGGQLCNPDSSVSDNNIKADFSYGFMYFLVIIALLLSGYNFIRGKKK